MNREIKFRIFCLEGFVFLSSYGDKGERFWYKGDLVDLSWFLQCQRVESPKRFAITQYTGLKDKNGVEIYEGDIVNGHFGVGVVAFNTNNFAHLPAFHVCDKNGESLDYYYGVSPNYTKDLPSEVIGNIHENPELLMDKGEDE